MSSKLRGFVPTCASGVALTAFLAMSGCSTESRDQRVGAPASPAGVAAPGGGPLYLEAAAAADGTEPLPSGAAASTLVEVTGSAARQCLEQAAAEYIAANPAVNFLEDGCHETAENLRLAIKSRCGIAATKIRLLTDFTTVMRPLEDVQWTAHIAVYYDGRVYDPALSGATSLTPDEWQQKATAFGAPSPDQLHREVLPAPAEGYVLMPGRESESAETAAMRTCHFNAFGQVLLDLRKCAGQADGDAVLCQRLAVLTCLGSVYECKQERGSLLLPYPESVCRAGVNVLSPGFDPWPGVALPRYDDFKAYEKWQELIRSGKIPDPTGSNPPTDAPPETGATPVAPPDSGTGPTTPPPGDGMTDPAAPTPDQTGPLAPPPDDAVAALPALP